MPADFCRQLNTWGAEGLPFFFLIDYAGEKPEAYPLATAIDHGIQFAIGKHCNIPDTPCYPPWDIHFQATPPPKSRYADAFRRVQQAIHDGDTYLLNLTLPSAVETNLDLYTIFRLANAPYRVYKHDTFTCFSPEQFIAIEGDTIHTHPMKGTIFGQGAELLNSLLQDPKETAEHATITDLLRNDLGKVAQQVRVDNYRYAQVVQTHVGSLWQTSTHIRGQAGSDWPSRIGDILDNLLPAGSICGAPKSSTCRVIAEAEGYSRGYYTGVAGVFDGQSLESAVLIRYIEQQPGGQFLFKSGGGITAFSDEDEEYQELCNKIYLPF